VVEQQGADDRAEREHRAGRDAGQRAAGGAGSGRRAVPLTFEELGDRNGSTEVSVT